jgi:hypothetical protein
LLAVFINQIRPPIKLQKEEKLVNLITHAFTINQVPHVFGEHHFAGHNYKNMEDFTERRFSNSDLHKGTRETATKPTQNGLRTLGKQLTSSPWPATQRWWQGGSVRDRPFPRCGGLLSGAPQPPLALVVAWIHAEAVHPR